MPFSYCGQYYSIRGKLEQAVIEARATGMAPEEWPAFRQALTQLRAHAEVCPECIGAFFGAFAEEHGKMIRVEGSHE